MTPSLARRPGPSVRLRVREYVEARSVAREDRVVTEEPLEVRLAAPGHPTARVFVTMRTPGNDFELAAGWLFHEGVIARADDIASVVYCTHQDLSDEEEFNVVTVRAHRAARVPEPRLDASSACGVCGTSSIGEALKTLGHHDHLPDFGVDAAVIRSLPEALRAGQRVFDATGGIHAAGLFDDRGRLLLMREDVGRHNAVDKVAGAQLLAGNDPGPGLLCTSGRIGFEIVQKAVAARRTAVVGVGAPTSLAVRYAEEAGLILVGFARGERFVAYAGHDRIHPLGG